MNVLHDSAVATPDEDDMDDEAALWRLITQEGWNSTLRRHGKRAECLMDT